MSRLIVTAEASPLFGNFLMLVSVSAESDGTPLQALKPKNFTIYHLASLNHAFPTERDVTEAKEGPNGFYTLTLKPKEYQPDLPPGHYVFAVAVKTFSQGKTKGRGGSSVPKDHGQTIAVGDLPTYGQWK
jgi:hypothetical protein